MTRATALLILCLAAANVAAGEWRGNVALEGTLFLHDPLSPEQSDSNLSLSAEPEYFHDWDDGNQRFVFAPFLRADENDAERTHFDLREMYWRRSFDSAELSVGLRKVFWGVTESLHLVDIINQTDFVENLDGEDKLGQPMASLSLLRDWGTVELFVMPYFRERTFAGPEGRPRPGFFVDQDNPVYESSTKERRLDLALRYSHYIGDWDFGLAHFSGTSREPRLEPAFDPVRGIILVPHYDVLNQTSLDIQATKGNWLWKLELISRDNADGRSTAFAAGFEYTLYGLFGSAVDLGLIAEYLFDDRPEIRGAANDDIALGGRFALNDEQDTQLLAFSVVDADSRSSFSSIEGSRRIGQTWRLSLEARFFSDPEPGDFLFALRDDDYVELTLEKFF